VSKPPGCVCIHYLRPPDHLEVYTQPLVHDGGDFLVTYLEHARRERPAVIAGEVAMEDGSPIVWTTYRGDVWHDVGRVHRADGTLTGFYANVLTPVMLDGADWHTTDLFVDVWCSAGGRVEILDRDELDAALAAGHLSPELGERALAEAHRLASAARAGTWPPPEIHAWTLERVRSVLAPPE